MPLCGVVFDDQVFEPTEAHELICAVVASLGYSPVWEFGYCGVNECGERMVDDWIEIPEHEIEFRWDEDTIYAGNGYISMDFPIADISDPNLSEIRKWVEGIISDF